MDCRVKPGNDSSFPTTSKSTLNFRKITMTKVLVLYYSAYGHIEAMANAIAAGARDAGATVDIKRVPELVPAEVAKASHYKLDQAAPIAGIEELANYDAIIVGTGTRFGRMASQCARRRGRQGAVDDLRRGLPRLEEGDGIAAGRHHHRDRG
jgi:hypothetical protein